MVYIYKITNNINGKVYVGQHSMSDPKYYASGVAINRSLKKYGKENFIREIIDQGNYDQQQLNILEQQYILEFCSYFYDYPERGYNLTKGGECKKGGKLSNESKLKCKLNSTTKKGVVQLSLNGKFIKEHFNMKDASRSTNVCRTSILGSCKNRTFSAGGFVWVYASFYNSANFQFKQQNINTIKISQFSLCGTFLKEYESAGLAAKEMGVSRTAICLVLSGKNKTCKRFIWKYSH